MVKEGLTLTQRTQYGTYAKRQIRTKSTIFLFLIMELYGALGLEFVETLRRHKPLLNYASITWKLPKLIRTFVTDLTSLPYGILGAKFDANVDTYFNIQIDLENLHELEQQNVNVTELNFQMLYLFLHECAHFKTKNEKEADSLVKELIENFSR